MNLNMNLLQKKFGKNFIINENLSKYNWFNLGGPAEIFFRPQYKDQLLSFITEKAVLRMILKMGFIY